jgi:hypothetical protein
MTRQEPKAEQGFRPEDLLELQRRIEQMSLKTKSDILEFTQSISQTLSNKPDFTDLEAIAHKIHTKADIEKVLELTQAIKRETSDSITKLKKDNKN